MLKSPNYENNLPPFILPEYSAISLISICTSHSLSSPDVYFKIFRQITTFNQRRMKIIRIFHRNKMEDIINRGGGNLIFRLWNATENGEPADTDVLISKDGRNYYVQAGEEILLTPGESLTLYPYYYHEFIVQPGSGKTLIGEVSKCNDDNTNNYFLEAQGRFPSIEEDEAPYRLLCTEYPPAKD